MITAGLMLSCDSWPSGAWPIGRCRIMNAPERIKEIFIQALEKHSPAEREAYVAQACNPYCCSLHPIMALPSQGAAV